MAHWRLLLPLSKSQAYMRRAGRDSLLPPSGDEGVLDMQKAVTRAACAPPMRATSLPVLRAGH